MFMSNMIYTMYTLLYVYLFFFYSLLIFKKSLAERANELYGIFHFKINSPMYRITSIKINRKLCSTSYRFFYDQDLLIRLS